jgi:hypothetical protein
MPATTSLSGSAWHPEIGMIDDIIQLSRARTADPDRWIDDPTSGAFSPFKQILLLERALKLASPEYFSTRRALVRALHLRMTRTNTLPARRSAGSKNGQVSWDADTLDNYLRGRSIKPTPEETQNILETLIELTEAVFASTDRVGRSVRHVLLQQWSAPSKCLEMILGSLALALPNSPAEERSAPPEPAPAPGPQYGPVLGKLSETVGAPSEDEADKQASLHQHLRSAARALTSILNLLRIDIQHSSMWHATTRRSWMLPLET